jgi:ribose transport system substrate-binding protein
MRSGAKAVFSALGIKIFRFADYSFNPNGMAGMLTAVLSLRPNILVTGGTVNAAQFAAIIKPAIDQGVTVTAWSLGSPTMKIGQDEPLKAMTTYDFYNLGLQMADAIHQTWPNGANFGYIHWINDVDAIHARENGLLDGLKNYPNIKIITNGEPSPRNPASGFTDPSNSTPFTQAFLTAHPEVNVLFAPWEDPPAIGEAAAIKALHLEDKVKIGTMDLGEAGAYQMRHDGIIAMDMAQDVYDGRPADGAHRCTRCDRPKHPPLRDGPDLPCHDQDGYAGGLGLYARAGGQMSQGGLQRLTCARRGRSMGGSFETNRWDRRTKD